jgi:rRNA biogenesis protein RRP5
MAPIKRKGNSAEETAAARQPQKRVRVGADEHKKDQKKQRTGASGDGRTKSDTSSAPKSSELTVLRDDEPSFPRGGGSVLTPLERKQIQIQATKDVLFEQKGAKDSSEAFENDEDAEMEDVDDTATATKKSRKRKTKSSKADETKDKQGVRIEGLHFKVCLRRDHAMFYDSMLMKAAYCSRDHGARSSFKHQCT